MKLNPEAVRQSISNLLLQYPELAEDEVLRADMVEAETQADVLLTEIVERMQEASTMAGAIGSRIAELGLRQERYERRELAMRELAKKVLETADLKKIELPIATLSMRNGTQRVVITDEQLLPVNCIRIKREPDKTTIKELLCRGENVPGALLSNAEPSLSVRVK